MKLIAIISLATLGVSSAHAFEPLPTDPVENYHNMIVDSFSRAGFQTDQLKITTLSRQQIPDFDYGSLVRESFRRAGMDVPQAAPECTNQMHIENGLIFLVPPDLQDLNAGPGE